MTFARRLRIIHEPDTSRPWIVQYDDPHHARTWKDVARFTTYDRASAYLEDIHRRDRALLEADR